MNGERDETRVGTRLRQGFAALGERALPGPDCPEPDRLWAAAASEGAAAERQEVLLHTASCASCAAAFRLARGLVDSASEGAGKQPAEAADLAIHPAWTRRRWLRWSAPLAAAAALLVATLLIPGAPWHRPAPYRGGTPAAVRSLLPQGVPLDRAAAELRWSPGPPGSRYDLSVLTPDGREIVAESGLESPRFRVPASALAGLPPGARLYWQVKVLGPEGAITASRSFPLRLR